MFNEFVNKRNVIAFLKKEIKEISERWAGFQISLRAITENRKNWTIFPNKDVNEYKKTQKKLLELQEEGDRQKFLAKMPKKQRDAFDEWQAQHRKEVAEIQAENGTKECEEFLETAVELLNEIKMENQAELNRNSTTAIEDQEIIYE